MEKPTFDQAEEIKRAAIKEAEDREVFEKIKYICRTLAVESQPLLGSGVIVFFDPLKHFVKAYRAENDGRLVFVAKKFRNAHGPDWVEIAVFRTGAWVDCLQETYDDVKFKDEKGNVRKIMRDFWPLKGHWNEP